MTTLGATNDAGTGWERRRSARRHDFSRLKRVIGITEVLAHYGLDADLREHHGELVGPCPLPDHGGDRDNRGAFRVNPAKGVWHCMSHCGGGDIVALTALVENRSYAAAARVLVQLEAGVRPRRPHGRVRRASPLSTFRPYTKRLLLEPEHPLLRARRLTTDTCRAFEAGWWPSGGFLRGCVAVRLRDMTGSPLGYAGRRVDAGDRSRGKWKFPPRIPRASLLFNWHQARQHAASGLFVVEGPWDAMRVHQAGCPNVVALWGTTTTPAQLGLLARMPRIVLMLDGDPSGRAAAKRLTAALSQPCVSTVSLPDGHDPADLSERELWSLIAPHVTSAVRNPSPHRRPT